MPCSRTKPAASKEHLDVVWEVPQQTDEEVLPRDDFEFVKYSKSKPLTATLLDSYIDGFQRTATLFFGRIESNPDDIPAFEVPLGYNMTYNSMASGKGNALHRHSSVEIFVALDAPFKISYGSEGEFNSMLMPWDIVACPAEAVHSYRNMGEDGGQILTLLCGKPSITWASCVVDQARKNGAVCDDTGKLLSHSASAKRMPQAVVPWGPDGWLTPSRQSTGEESFASEDSVQDWREYNGVSLASQDTAATDSDIAEWMKQRAALQGTEAKELILDAGALDKFVYRYSDRHSRTLKLGSSVGTLTLLWVDLAPRRVFAPEETEDTLIVVLGGSVTCQDRHYVHLDVLKQPNILTGGAQGATLLVARSILPHNLDFIFDATIMNS